MCTTHIVPWSIKDWYFKRKKQKCFDYDCLVPLNRCNDLINILYNYDKHCMAWHGNHWQNAQLEKYQTH